MFRFIEHIVIGLWNRVQGRSERPAKNASGSIVIGHRVAEGEVTKQRLALSQTRLTMHAAVLGKSGSGKSSLLKHLIYQKILAGLGGFVLDLHDELIWFIIRVFSALEEARQIDLSHKIVFLSPSDPSMSVGLNPLEGIGDDFGRIAEFAEVIRKHANLDYLGARTEELLRNAIAVLASNGLTLLELAPLLSNTNFRAQCLATVANTEVLHYFEARYGQASQAMQATMREPILNKVSAFTADPRLRHIVGQSHSTFSMKEAMDKGHWVIAHTPKSKLGGQALTLAGILFTHAKNAIFTRERRSLFTFYLDEMQNLVPQSADVETMLSEARKFGVGIVAANQYLSQYPDSMRAAILSVASHVSFQLSNADAVVVAQMLDGGKPLAETLKNLRQRHFILKSGSDHWVEGRVPDVEEPTCDYRDLLNRSQARYARPRAEIEREIAARQATTAQEPREVLNGWE